MPVRIVTDSSADLPAAEAERLGVEVVPLSIRFGHDEYTDGVDLSVAEFYDKLATASELPETAAPSPGAFEAAFRRQASAGADAVVCINLSSGLSATIQSAQNAAKALDGELDVRVVDSRSITSGLGTQVTLAAEAAAGGAGADDVVALVEGLAGRTHVFGALDTLDNLKKGGRIGGAQAAARLAAVDQATARHLLRRGGGGRAGPAPGARRWSGCATRSFALPTVEHLCVAHGMAPDVDADAGPPRRPAIRPTRSRVTIIGPTIGTHGGPRVMGLTWIDPA